jgi:capsular exopolysaccharide synthesis family protein
MVPKRRYLSFLRERWWVVLIGLALSVGGVVVFETVRTERFDSHAQLYVTTGVQVGPGLFGDPKEDFATQIELLKGSRLRGAALTALGERGARLQTPIDIDVVRPMGTSILRLRATGADPALAQAFLQALIDSYLAFKKETRVSTTEDLVTTLNEQLTRREEELKAEQEKWVDFQRTNTLAVLEEEARGASLYLAELNVQLAKLSLEEDLLRKGLGPAPDPTAAANALSTAPGTDSHAVAAASIAASNGPPLVASDAALKGARLELAILLGERVKLAAQFSETHPAVRSVSGALERLTNTIAVLERRNAEQKRVDLAEVQKRIDCVRAAIPEVERKVLEASERLSQSQRYKNELQRQQGRYESLLGMLQNLDVGRNMAQERTTVLEPPSPGRPPERSFAFRLLLAVVGGGFLSLGIVFAWHLLDDRFVSVRDVKDHFGEPILGLIPEIKIARSRPREALLRDGDSRRAYAESYRHLRSALLLSASGGRRPHTLLLTSATPAEGKSTIAANMAAVLARSGLRVALVDADTRASGLGPLLGLEGKPGMLDLLRGDLGVRAIQHPTAIPSLTVVPRGTRVEPAEGLFLRPQLTELMDDLRAGSEFVIIDSPPILGADDAALLVPSADTVVVVVRPFHSRSRLVRQALEMLYQRQAKQVAIILNRARRDDLAGHYGGNGTPPANSR